MVTLKKASFVKFRPRSKDFLEISNPKAVLEKALASLAGNFAQQKTGVVFPEAEMGALNGIDSLVQASGLAPPGDE